MHVGVIGGTGHISTSIVRVLLAQGHAVTCVNRGLRGVVAPGARLVRGDRRERAAFEPTPPGGALRRGDRYALFHPGRCPQ